MVSKIAVIALVAIVAAPILLGYAFNLTQVTETEYKADGESINVSELLQNGTSYTYANANPYDLNTRFAMGIVGGTIPIKPIYKTVTTASTTLKMNQGVLSLSANAISANNYNSFAGTIYYYMGNNTNITYADLSSDGQTTYHSANNVTSLIFNPTDNTVTYSVQGGGKTTITPHASNGLMFFKNNGGSTVKIKVSTFYPSDNHYVDFSSGYYFEKGSNYYVNLMPYTRSVLFTIDLSSYTDNSLFMAIGRGNTDDFYLRKTSANSWDIGNSSDFPSNLTHLYYDSSRSSNTYQVLIEYVLTDSDQTYDYYNRHVEFRYVGNWPSFIGKANYYQVYTLDEEITMSAGTMPSMNNLQFSVSNNASTPVIRVDDAYFRAFTYQSITNQVYTPASFKTNPITTIDNINIYGTSITFAGNTYEVSDGKITLNGHKISVNGLQFSSVPNNGSYDNKIGNTVISSSVSPSTITFNGSWAASISTDSMQLQTITKTEWHVGEFGWDGIDQNFLIVGLITCLGVFVGLGIYARKRGTGGLIPLMIVTGCAAAVFFIML